MQITALQSTVLKKSAAQAFLLPPSQKKSVSRGNSFSVTFVREEKNHAVVMISGEQWFAFKPHWHLQETGVNLAVPHFTQLDNRVGNYWQQCNVTCCAMVAHFKGVRPRDPKRQLEEEMYLWAMNNGASIFTGPGMVRILGAFGVKDDFRFRSSWDRIRDTLRGGNPVIVHGWFTRSGHIIVIRGFNDRGWIVNDPWGEWFASGYKIHERGGGLLYSFDMMQRLCAADGDLWAHHIG